MAIKMPTRKKAPAPETTPVFPATTPVFEEAPTLDQTSSAPRGDAYRRPSQRPASYWSTLAIHRVPPKFLLFGAFVSYLILGIGYLQGAPVWLAFGLALAPWGLMMFIEMEWAYRHFGWFALFGLMAFVQLIHYTEHCFEVLQVHVFRDPASLSLGLYGGLNVESVHFGGDTFLTIGTLFLLTKFPRNRWLWVAAPVQILHGAEHLFLMFNYVFKGALQGGPGMLASPGGAIGGGVGLIRADLHWIYNTLFTIPFVLALIHQLKQVYDEALDKAFPKTPKAELAAAGKHLETFRYQPSQTVLARGEQEDRVFIITEGQAVVCVRNPEGGETVVRTLRPGQYFGETGLRESSDQAGTLRAKTRLTCLVMDARTFRHLMSVAQVSDGDIVSVARGELADLAKGAAA